MQHRSTTPKSDEVVSTEPPSLCGSKAQLNMLGGHEPNVGVEVLATVYTYVLNCPAERGAPHLIRSTIRKAHGHERTGSDA